MPGYEHLPQAFHDQIETYYNCQIITQMYPAVTEFCKKVEIHTAPTNQNAEALACLATYLCLFSE